MKSTPAVLAFGTLLLLTSCMKERSIDSTDPDNPGGGGAAGTRLTRLVSKTGQDSSVTLFTYTGGGKLATFSGTTVLDGETVDLDQRVERNGSDIITRVILKSSALAQVGLDSLISRYNYNSSQSRYTSRVTTVELLGFVFRDSTAYAYDGSGKIISAVSYSDEGGGYGEVSKVEYGYAGNNLSSETYSSFDDQTGQYTEDGTITYGYDAKTAALQLGNEAILLSVTQYYSGNNVSSLAITYSAAPEDNDAVTFTYEYNANNQPVKATTLSQASGESSTLTYTYR